MSNDVLALARKNLRGTDSNSLLRLYDLANGIVNTSPGSRSGRTPTGLRRIATELERRLDPAERRPRRQRGAHGGRHAVPRVIGGAPTSSSS